MTAVDVVKMAVGNNSLLDHDQTAWQVLFDIVRCSVIIKDTSVAH